MEGFTKADVCKVLRYHLDCCSTVHYIRKIVYSLVKLRQRVQFLQLMGDKGFHQAVHLHKLNCAFDFFINNQRDFSHLDYLIHRHSPTKSLTVADRKLS